MNLDLKSLNIPDAVKQEIAEFAAEVERRNRGEVPEEEFKRFRLQQGIYGQRQDEEQMVRTKLPQGKMTSDQLHTLANFGEKYGHGILHVTTRQDIQFHFVNIQDVPKGMQELAEAGMTTREACGNTVRNVTGCHKSGTCPEELFDVSPYARAVTDFLIRHPQTQNLPRKFKISFGGCRGCALAPIHDIGCNAAVREVNGKKERGFKVIIGGGLGSSPHSAKLLTEFLPAGDLLRMCETMVRLFGQHGDKQNRNKARFKFVIDKYGMDKVKELYEEQFAALADQTFPEIDVPDPSIPNVPSFEPISDFDDDPEFVAWKSRNTSLQKQEGFYNVQIKLLLGDLTIVEARALADIAQKYAAGELVNTVNQNIMIPWVRESCFARIFGELKNYGLHKAGTEIFRDVTCCPGSETCNLGITHSRGLAADLSEGIINEYTANTELDQLSIKISGCPNSCGQHHIASIGFNGGAKKVQGVLTPHYEMMLGGRLNGDEAVFGIPVIKIPAKNVSAAVKKTVDDYQANKSGEESFVEFFDRKGKKYFQELLEDLKDLPSIEEAPESYIDYHSKEAFTLDDRGQGECAGPISDIIQDNLALADRALFQAKLAMEKENYPDAVQHINRTVAACAHGLLMTEGMDFSDELTTLEKFESLMIEMGIVSESLAGITQRFQDDPEKADAQYARSRYEEAVGLIEESKAAYNKMTSEHTLRIRVGEHLDAPAPPAGNGSGNGSGKVLESIDLLGVKSPTNYVQTKLKLDGMKPGYQLEVLLDDGEAISKLPRNVQNDGHKLVSMEKVENHYRVVIEKG